MEDKITYRLITDDMNQFVGQAKVKNGVEVVEVRMYGVTYTNPDEWMEKFGLGKCLAQSK